MSASTAQTVLPRWRGFNLLYLFTARRYTEPVEDDFRWIRDLGFDFIRLPMSYRIRIEGNDLYKIKEEPFENIDKVVEWGRRYGIHTSLNFHRGPGHGIGLALWNFRGPFGIIDSGRKDVDYEDFHGDKLDRKLLYLLNEFA